MTGKVVFSSDQLPVALDDRQRFGLWRDLYAAQYGLLDFTRAEDRPFAAHLEFAQFGPVATGRFEGAVTRARRTRYELRRDARDELFLFFNCGHSSVEVRQCGRGLVVQPGGSALLNYYEPGDCLHGQDHRWTAFTVERHRLQSLIRNVEDLVAMPLDSQSEAMTHLQRYARFLSEEGAAGEDSALTEHIGNSLLDLIALAIGPNRDAIELARMRGLRAARLRAVLAQIEAHFGDPEFSLDSIVKQQQLSARYVQSLLQDSGCGFTERVAELRLQKARRMLIDIRHERMAIGDIAGACGFTDAAYFTRRFRMRFGLSPTGFRAQLPSSDEAII